MEYFRDENNQIQADLAYRLGTVINQYEEMELNKKFEISLCISVLQTLLTNCIELIEAMEKHETQHHPLKNTVTNSPSLFGLTSSMIKKNTLRGNTNDFF